SRGTEGAAGSRPKSGAAGPAKNRSGFMIIYGRNAVTEALGQGQVERLLVARGLNPNATRQYEKLARQAGVPVHMMPRIELDRLVRTTSHQGVAAELPDLSYSDRDAPLELAQARGEQLFLVLLDQ